MRSKMTLLKESILLVEDDEFNSELLKRRLETLGYGVTTSKTGSKALELLKANKFNLVLLDIMLPDINGDILLHKIKIDPALNNTQVIMVTANSDREMVLKCIDAGAIDYLIKPFSMPIVKTRIWRCLKNAKTESKLNTTSSPFENSKILLIDDQELNRDILAHRLKKSGYQISSFTNGQEALEALKHERFDLVLLDIMMPDISGIDVLKKIRKLDANNDTPVIMITALDDTEIINECMEVGADDYILKPFNTTLLKLRISSCLQSRMYSE